MGGVITNHFAGGPIDRAAARRAEGGWLLEQIRRRGAVAIPVHGPRLWITSDPPGALCLSADEHLEDDHALASWSFLGLLDGRATFAFDSSARPIDPFERTGQLATLREVAARVPRNDAALLAYANALLYWQFNSRFCGRCGAENILRMAGHVMHCPACDRERYPRTSPAVIVLVHDDNDRCLLGRQAAWPPGVYSTLAGFVEPGESLEEAVRREVLEEVGIEVDPPQYDSSQPWPFPDSLMLGFHARAVSHDIVVDEEELEDARWFTRSEVLAADRGPKLPPRFSIARRLIETWAMDP